MTASIEKSKNGNTRSIISCKVLDWKSLGTGMLGAHCGADKFVRKSSTNFKKIEEIRLNKFKQGETT